MTSSFHNRDADLNDRVEKDAGNRALTRGVVPIDTWVAVL
jgi:hypothetical protein